MFSTTQCNIMHIHVKDYTKSMYLPRIPAICPLSPPKHVIGFSFLDFCEKLLTQVIVPDTKGFLSCKLCEENIFEYHYAMGNYEYLGLNFGFVFAKKIVFHDSFKIKTHSLIERNVVYF
jgi:hypothetical protein